MQEDKCSHIWEMVNVASGLIVMKKCFHCGKVSTCFCFHDKLPLEPSHEGEHFWNFMEADPSFHFNLKCTKCNIIVEMEELVGLMICTGCDEECKVNICRQKLEAKDKQVYIALGCRPIDDRKQLPEKKLVALQEYFNQQSNLAKTKIVPHKMIKNVATCYAVPLSSENICK